METITSLFGFVYSVIMAVLAIGFPLILGWFIYHSWKHGLQSKSKK